MHRQINTLKRGISRTKIGSGVTRGGIGPAIRHTKHDVQTEDEVDREEPYYYRSIRPEGYAIRSLQPAERIDQM